MYVGDGAQNPARGDVPHNNLTTNVSDQEPRTIGVKTDKQHPHEDEHYQRQPYKSQPTRLRMVAVVVEPKEEALEAQCSKTLNHRTVCGWCACAVCTHAHTQCSAQG